MIRCRDCTYFILDKIGDGHGIGRCKQYSQYKATGAPQSELKTLLIELGNRPESEIFWPGGLKDRNCNRYKDRNL